MIRYRKNKSLCNPGNKGKNWRGREDAERDDQISGKQTFQSFNPVHLNSLSHPLGEEHILSSELLKNGYKMKINRMIKKGE